jgi:hypothetical protein
MRALPVSSRIKDEVWALNWRPRLGPRHIPDETLLFFATGCKADCPMAARPTARWLQGRLPDGCKAERPMAARPNARSDVARFAGEHSPSCEIGGAQWRPVA